VFAIAYVKDMNAELRYCMT